MTMALISMHLIAALIQVESKGDDRAIGDFVRGRPTSFGCLQISEKVLADVTRISGRKVTAANAFHRLDSIWICRTYLDYYATKERLGREPTDQDRARIWNGGPDGWCKPETVPYWAKVSRIMVTSDDGTWSFKIPKIRSSPYEISLPTSRPKPAPSRAP